ncbi:MAG: response regulator, partial [Syntrophorhabdaceae bacterium]|nr:response regulator [Syntrophorhabdaceae bacterium]
MRVLVVDDSALFRRVLSDVLSSMQGIEVVGWAPNGKVALDKIRDLKPDLVTLDLEMPEMNGLAVIDALSGTKNAPAIIVVSALTKKGGQLTLEALQKGAFDFITKPEGASPEKSKEQLRMELTARLKAFSDRTGLKRPTPRQELETKTPKNIVAGRPGKPE